MIQNSYIKCPECHTRNHNTDYCVNCGAIINVVLKRSIEEENKIRKKVEFKEAKGPDKIEKFLIKASEHPNSLVRAFIGIAHSVWTFMAMVIGMLIAMVIAIAAG